MRLTSHFAKFRAIGLAGKLFSTMKKDPMAAFGALPALPKFDTLEEERVHRKQRLAASFRLFSKFGFDEGVAGHITARDPIETGTFWVNAFGVHFSEISVSNLIRVNHAGEIIEGKGMLNAAAFAIHSNIHHARPDVVAACHSHSTYGRAWSTTGKPLRTLTQDACAFHNDHVVYDDFGGVVVELDEGARIARALGKCKAAILQNHGLLTVGETVDAAAWWYIAMEKCCQVQLLAEASRLPLIEINKESAAQASIITGSPFSGWFQFQPLYKMIVKEQPNLLL
jgi:ribulose-5-phosphate 4-epimerase/fuculose-1-phosphate aldolase